MPMYLRRHHPPTRRPTQLTGQHQRSVYTPTARVEQTHPNQGGDAAPPPRRSRIQSASWRVAFQSRS
eukprot:scaffold665_cov341-Prasinococcus_capsulatus_cf.AAC.2